MILTTLTRRYKVSREPLRSERRVELVVVALALVILLQLLLLGARYLSPVAIDPLPPAPDSLSVRALADAAGVTSEQSLVLQARPVFWDSRRPLDPVDGAMAGEPSGAQAPAGALRGLSVSGILAMGDASRVLVNYKGRQQRLAIGETLDGWTLAEVRPGEVVFASKGTRDVRRLLQLPVTDGGVSPDSGVAPAGTGVSQGGAQGNAELASELLQDPQQAGQEPIERLSLGGQGARQ